MEKNKVGQRHFGKRRPGGADHGEKRPGPAGLDISDRGLVSLGGRVARRRYHGGSSCCQETSRSRPRGLKTPSVSFQVLNTLVRLFSGAGPVARSVASSASQVVARPKVCGIGSAHYAARFGAVWRPTRSAEAIEWPLPLTYPGGPETPPQIDFGAFLESRIPALGVIEIEGARLVEPWGWIVGTDDLLFRDHTWFSRQLDKPYFERLWAASQRATAPVPGTTLSLLTDFGATNYAHFLLDALGRLGLVAAAGIDLAAVDRILVPKPCSENARRILAALPLPKEKIVLVDEGDVAVLRPERLLAPTYPGVPCCYAPEPAEFLRSHVLGAAPATPPRAACKTAGRRPPCARTPRGGGSPSHRRTRARREAEGTRTRGRRPRARRRGPLSPLGPPPTPPAPPPPSCSAHRRESRNG